MSTPADLPHTRKRAETMTLPVTQSQVGVIQRKMAEELRRELETLLPLTPVPLPSSPYDKVAAAAVQCYSTFAVLATFLAGLQAGFMSRFVSDSLDSTLAALGLSIGTAALLLQISVVILSTIVILSLTIDKLIVAVSAGPPSSPQPGGTGPHQPFLILLNQVVELKQFGSMGRSRKSSEFGSKPTPVKAATRIVARMRGSFWDLGAVLVISAICTLVDVVLWAWAMLASGITASVVTFVALLLLCRICYNLIKTSTIDYRTKGPIFGRVESSMLDV